MKAVFFSCPKTEIQTRWPAAAWDESCAGVGEEKPLGRCAAWRRPGAGYFCHNLWWELACTALVFAGKPG